MALDSMQEIFDAAALGNKQFWEVVLDADMEEREVTAEQSMEKMRASWRAMLEADDTYSGDLRSASGLVGRRPKCAAMPRLELPFPAST